MQLIKDLYSGEQFSPRRKNQKFVSSKNRIAFHNNRAYQSKSIKAFVTEPLNRNHKILMELINDTYKPKTYSKEFLKGKGFSLSVITHFDTFENKTLPALFNFIYLDLFENKSLLTIIRKS
jgi:hypothetical protein